MSLRSLGTSKLRVVKTNKAGILTIASKQAVSEMGLGLHQGEINASCGRDHDQRPESVELPSVAVALAHRTLWLYPEACATSAAVLLMLDRMRGVLSRPALRAAADAALLTPLLFVPLLLR